MLPRLAFLFWWSNAKFGELFPVWIQDQFPNYAVYQENYRFKSYPTVCFEKLQGEKDIFSSIMKCFKTYKFKHLAPRIYFSKMKYLDNILNERDRKQLSWNSKLIWWYKINFSAQYLIQQGVTLWSIQNNLLI